MAFLKLLRALSVFAATAIAVGGIYLLFQGNWGAFIVCIVAFIVVSIIGGASNAAVLKRDAMSAAETMMRTEALIWEHEYRIAEATSDQALRAAEKIFKQGGRSFDLGVHTLVMARMQRSIVLSGLGEYNEARRLMAQVVSTMKSFSTETPEFRSLIQRAQAIHAELAEENPSDWRIIDIYRRNP